ncbi:hypothetical protein Y032_0038g3573 [Ancylostoma ceylanicum]|uniref:Uncharacterized protein n=1 Tax=Ancylostoma ceylanicum TaxID=53326 RepID=A0A016UJE2_9BILA|nr:hypothetical protein Y032_0038g3573 [Ancylostoma ceylanicum]
MRYRHYIVSEHSSMGVLFFVALCLYCLGTLTAIPIWYLIFKKRFLHTNFRILIFLITFGGQCVSVLIYTRLICSSLNCYATVCMFSYI